MGWAETHRYYAALREIEEQLDAGSRHLPWRPEYAELFGDRTGLLLALARRWRVLVEARYDPGGVSLHGWAELALAHPGLVRTLRRHGMAAPAGAAPAGAA